MKKYLSVVVLLFMSVNVHASFIDTDVACSIEPSTLWECDSASATVADGTVEFILQLLGSDLFALDIDADSIQMENLGGGFGAGAGEFLSLTFLAGLFDQVAFNVISNVTGVENSDLSFDGENLTFDFNNTSWSEDSFVTISFVDNAPVPMPNAPTLLLLALGLVGVSRLSRK